MATPRPGDRLLTRLCEDHRLTHRILDRLEELAEQAQGLADGGELQALLASALPLARLLLEGEVHEHCEEDALFPAMRAHQSDVDPNMLTLQHNLLRTRKRSLLEFLGAPRAEPRERQAERFHRHIRGIAPVLRDHMTHEEEELYPRAREVLSGAEWARIERHCTELGAFLPPGVEPPVTARRSHAP